MPKRYQKPKLKKIFISPLIKKTAQIGTTVFALYCGSCEWLIQGGCGKVMCAAPEGCFECGACEGECGCEPCQGWQGWQPG